jgi:hypothetical protein
MDPSGRGIIVRGSVVQLSQIRTLIEQMAAQGPSSMQRSVRVVPIGSQSTFVQQAIGALYPQVTVTTSAVPTPAATGTTSDNGRSRSSRSNNNDEDSERAERFRRFMEFRERMFGGSGSSEGGRGGDRNENRDRGGDRGGDRGRRDND